MSAPEARLDDPRPAVRRAALRRLAATAPPAPPPGREVNLHAHTFYSYNPYGYSPSRFAWLARARGLAVAGIVDFDVLDGVDEFLAAGRLLGLKATAGLETRVFVPEFASRVINSPGEPGISYHMGIGFPSRRVPVREAAFFAGLKATAQARNRALAARVNAFLRPVEVDVDRDAVPLTPAGNVTERHLCLAYARRAAAVLGTGPALAEFWSAKLGADAAALDLPDGPKLQAAIRARTMKRGGPGYVAPDGGSFPRMADLNRFALECGAIPTLTWLDGTSDGEQAIGELVDVAAASGAAALNVIPDRNFTPGVVDAKLRNLQAVVALAERRGLPVVVGTEMNSPGNKFVDAFESAELAPLAPVFLKGARIVYAHTVLQRAARMGYLSPWARRTFGTVAEKNAFFEEFGRAFPAGREAALEIGPAPSPERVLAAARAAAGHR